MNFRSHSLLLLPLAAILLLAGCGEKSEPPTTGPVVTQTTTGSTNGQTTTAPDDSGQSDRRFVSQSAISFLAGPNAERVCDSGITPRFLKTSYGDRAGCIAARKPQSLADSVQLSDIQIGQGTATLTAEARGGVYGTGQKLKMSLVRSGTGAWLVDSVKSNAPVGP